MDNKRTMKRIRRQLSPSKHRDFAFTLVACLMILLVLFTVSVIYRNPQSDQEITHEARLLDEEDTQIGGEDNSSQSVGSSQLVDDYSSSPSIDNHSSSKSIDKHEDRLLDGILSSDFDEQSCLSRYQSALYRKASPYKPSPYLLSRLRKYEALHKKCGPYTKAYNETIEKLKSAQNIHPTDCNYVVWISFRGLGNRILTLASAFLYAILTNRVLLVDRGADLAELFCEPFPETSWLLPLDFPFNQFDKFDEKSPHCFGNMLKNNLLNDSVGSAPPFLYLNLAHSYNKHDKLFFCDQEQTLLQKVPWLIMRSNMYFVPSLFLMSSFEQELNNLFPSKETVFHHLGRYLIHPKNVVWSMIRRYYEAYLAKVDERLGIQIRLFESGPGPFPYSLDQIRACYLKEKLLPEVTDHEPTNVLRENRKSKAVLVTSLASEYSESLRNMYYEQPTTTGEIIGIYQPSSEEEQQSDKLVHERKALADIYLLSMADELITSAWSTFGYVAQGLGGLKPWILTKPMNFIVPDPPCQRDMSMEPCFLQPPYYDCKKKVGIDTGTLIPNVRHCQDQTWGIKLVDHINL